MNVRSELLRMLGDFCRGHQRPHGRAQSAGGPSSLAGTCRDFAAVQPSRCCDCSPGTVTAPRNLGYTVGATSSSAKPRVEPCQKAFEMGAPTTFCEVLWPHEHDVADIQRQTVRNIVSKARRWAEVGKRSRALRIEHQADKYRLVKCLDRRGRVSCGLTRRCLRQGTQKVLKVLEPAVHVRERKISRPGAMIDRVPPAQRGGS